MSRERLRLSLISESTNFSAEEWKLTSIVIKSSGFRQRTSRLKKRRDNQSGLASMAFHTWPLLHCVSAVWILIKPGERAKALHSVVVAASWSTNRLQLSQRTVMTKQFDDYTVSAGEERKCGWLVAVIGTNWIALALSGVNFQFYTVWLEFRYVHAKVSNAKRSSARLNRWKRQHFVSQPRLVELWEGLFVGKAVQSVDFRLMSIKSSAMHATANVCSFTFANEEKCLHQRRWCKVFKHFP